MKNRIVSQKLKHMLPCLCLLTTCGGIASWADMARAEDDKSIRGIPGMTREIKPADLPVKSNTSAETVVSSKTTEQQQESESDNLVRCINPHEALEMHSPKPEAPDVLKAAVALASAYGRGKLDRYGDLISDDCSLYDEHEGKTVSGREAILKRLKLDFQRDTAGGRQIVAYTIDSPYIKVLGGTAVVTYKAVKSIQGKLLEDEQTFVTEMFVKEGDNWKLTYWRAKSAKNEADKSVDSSKSDRQ